MKAFNDQAVAYALGRIGLGINIAFHGWTRLPKLSDFALEVQKQFAASILPAPLVYGSGYAIAIAEAIIGPLILLGFLLRPALVAGSLLMVFLLVGTCLIQNWNVAGLQLTYLAFYCALLAAARYDAYSIDSFRRRV
jgi:thiosulfate dehydrogenase [quinone] large subunit